MRDLVPHEKEKNDAFTRILRFYDKADIVLTSEEELILDRWIYCDTLLRSRKYKTPEIISNIVTKFGVSKFTAQKDIRDTYSLFGQTRAISKRYVLTNHIEDIQMQIQQVRFDKSLIHLLPKLDAELTKAVAALGDDIPTAEVERPNVIVSAVLVNESSPLPKLSIEEAKEKWKQYKEKKRSTVIEDIDHEDVKE